MTAYLINHLRVPPGLAEPDDLLHLQRVRRTTEPFGGRWLVLDAPGEVLEGAWPGSAVVMEFPDAGTAKAWYRSPDYQQILRLRAAEVLSDLILVDAVGPGCSATAGVHRVRPSLAGVGSQAWSS